MLITYAGRQYDSERKPDARLLAGCLRIAGRVADLHAQSAPQYQIDRALWDAILAGVGRGVLAGDLR